MPCSNAIDNSGWFQRVTELAHLPSSAGSTLRKREGLSERREDC